MLRVTCYFLIEIKKQILYGHVESKSHQHIIMKDMRTSKM